MNRGPGWFSVYTFSGGETVGDRREANSTQACSCRKKKKKNRIPKEDPGIAAISSSLWRLQKCPHLGSPQESLYLGSNFSSDLRGSKKRGGKKPRVAVW